MTTRAIYSSTWVQSLLKKKLGCRDKEVILPKWLEKPHTRRKHQEVCVFTCIDLTSFKKHEYICLQYSVIILIGTVLTPEMSLGLSTTDNPAASLSPTEWSKFSCPLFFSLQQSSV
jgi:hypothetical protein